MAGAGNLESPGAPNGHGCLWVSSAHSRGSGIQDCAILDTRVPVSLIKIVQIILVKMGIATFPAGGVFKSDTKPQRAPNLW